MRATRQNESIVLKMKCIGEKIRLVMALSLALTPVTALLSCACPPECHDAHASEGIANVACCHGRLAAVQALVTENCCEPYAYDESDNQTGVSRHMPHHEPCIHTAVKSGYNVVGTEAPALRSVPALFASQIVIVSEDNVNPGGIAARAGGLLPHSRPPIHLMRCLFLC